MALPPFSTVDQIVADFHQPAIGEYPCRIFCFSNKGGRFFGSIVTNWL